MNSVASVRLDKWLWAVRLYKSRSLAASACNAGKVLVGEQQAKPSRDVRVGDIIKAQTAEITRTVRVVAVLDRRVGPKLVPDYLQDLTPASEYNKPRERIYQPIPLRPRGTGRPTKKERRQWGAVMNDES
jgi:ribosome-associated heat shock protein Hsp15